MVVHSREEYESKAKMLLTQYLNRFDLLTTACYPWDVFTTNKILNDKFSKAHSLTHKYDITIF